MNKVVFIMQFSYNNKIMIASTFSIQQNHFRSERAHKTPSVSRRQSRNPYLTTQSYPQLSRVFIPTFGFLNYDFLVLMILVTFGRAVVTIVVAVVPVDAVSTVVMATVFQSSCPG